MSDSMLQKTIIKTPQIYHLIQEINLYLPQNIELSDFFLKYVSSVKHEEIIMRWFGNHFKEGFRV